MEYVIEKLRRDKKPYKNRLFLSRLVTRYYFTPRLTHTSYSIKVFKDKKEAIYDLQLIEKYFRNSIFIIREKDGDIIDRGPISRWELMEIK